ncbi:MAG: glycine betaine ABC transporter substrate-binding protein [Bacteroidales bacterium]|nr:glycine betaine ABC transporter substrate-binding protein [Bacteroidales bacterium]
MKYLDDPKGVFIRKMLCAILARKGFAEDMPKVAEFCGNFGLKEMQLYDLMSMIDETGNPEKAAQQWYEQHKGMVHESDPDN